MESGSWQVRVQVEGAQGAGELAVPVPAAARRTLPMQKSLGILLFALMSLLVVAIISIVGAARREATLPPGELPSAERSRRGRWMMLGAAVVVFGILYFGNSWWNSEASAQSAPDDLQTTAARRFSRARRKAPAENGQFRSGTAPAPKP